MEDLKFSITEDRHGLTMITWVNPPGLDAEFFPHQLKHLAEKLLEVAEAAEEMEF